MTNLYILLFCGVLKENEPATTRQKVDYQSLFKQQQVQLNEQIEAIERLEVWIAQLQVVQQWSQIKFCTNIYIFKKREVERGVRLLRALQQ